MKNTYTEIIHTSIPLILSTSGLAIMQFFDAMFLAHHSPTSLAAAGTSGCIAWTLSCFLLGLVGYTSVLTSNYVGARMEKKVGKAIWQGIYLSIFAGALTFLLSFFSHSFFIKCGHNAELAEKEGIYLQILLIAGVFNFAQSAMSGFFSGRKDNARLMIATLSGHGANILGDYVLIFGKLGFPAMGVSGAAVATVSSTALSFAIMASMFLSRRNRNEYATWRGRGFDWDMVKHLVHFGAPNGLLRVMDAILFSTFLVITGRIGEVALASTTVVWRLNALSLLPVIGMANGVGAFIGQSHGRKDHKATLDYIWKGATLSAIWMISVAATFVLMPSFYLNMFFEPGEAHYAELMKTSTRLLYFVALYCMVDSFNVSLCSGLQTVGDTKWTSMILSLFAIVTCSVLLFAGKCNFGLYAIWTIITIYIMAMPPFWVLRLRNGKWKNIVVAK